MSDLGVPTTRISEIVDKYRPITLDTAMRLAGTFNMEARFWLNLQAQYDVRVAQTKLLPEIKARIRPFEFQAALQICRFKCEGDPFGFHFAALASRDRADNCLS